MARPSLHRKVLLCCIPKPSAVCAQNTGRQPSFRNASLSAGSKGIFSAPKPASKSWERGAKLVKDTDVTSNEYVNAIRETHDPSQHVKTIEEELLGTMGKALGRQGDKVTAALTCMNREREIYSRLLSTEPNTAASQQQQQEEVRQCVIRHNQWRDKAKTARWELMVHRQAVGFIINNHEYVTKAFPIGDPLLVPSTDAKEPGTASGNKTGSESVTRVFGDQLDWWQKVGRWR